MGVLYGTALGSSQHSAHLVPIHDIPFVFVVIGQLAILFGIGLILFKVFLIVKGNNKNESITKVFPLAFGVVLQISLLGSPWSAEGRTNATIKKFMTKSVPCNYVNKNPDFRVDTSACK